ncbi:ribonuclease H-like domain-containing protein [Tanacetum coccineum]
MSVNGNFSLHDDEELSLHGDASLDGSVLASNKGDAPAKPPQIITTNTLSNIKLHVLQKDDYDTWAMEMEHYLRYFLPTTQQTQLDALGASVSDEDANHKFLRTKKSSHANHKFLRSLPPAWDSLAMTMRTKKNIDTLSIDDLYNNLSVFEQDIQKTSSSSLASDNVAFLSQAKASSSKHKPSQSSGSYSSYTTSSSKAKPTATPGLADEVIHSFLATNADDVDLIHEDLDQIDDLDLEEMDINWQIAMTAIKIKKFYKKTGRRPRVDGKMHVAFDKRKVECFNCHNTGHFARECKFKGSKEGSRQELSRGLGYGIKSNAEVLGYEEEISRGIFAFRETNAGYHDIPLYSRFKQVEYKGVPHPLSGDYTLGTGRCKDILLKETMFCVWKLSHLIKPLVTMIEMKMAREAALRGQRVVHADVRTANTGLD